MSKNRTDPGAPCSSLIFLPQCFPFRLRDHVPPDAANGSFESREHASAGGIIWPDGSNSGRGGDRADSDQFLSRADASALKQSGDFATDIRQVRQRLFSFRFHLHPSLERAHHRAEV